jgi:hypothetical protein
MKLSNIPPQRTGLDTRSIEELWQWCDQRRAEIQLPNSLISLLIL